MYSQNYKPKLTDHAGDQPVDAEFPKWITPHPSHVAVKEATDGSPAAVSIPNFEPFIDRVTGAVSVLVHNAEDEALMLAEKVVSAAHDPAPEPAKGDDGKAA